MVALTVPQSSVFCKSRMLLASLQGLSSQIPQYVSLLRGVRRTCLPLLPLSPNLHLHLHSLPLRRCFLLPISAFRSLLGPRTSSILLAMYALTTSPAESNSNSATETKKVVIKGRVQGVFYRDWTVQNASDLGLKGWVRNRRDGSVEALFSGPPEKAQEMIQRCRRGPPAASVTGLEAFPSDEDPGTGFERRRTA